MYILRPILNIGSINSMLYMFFHDIGTLIPISPHCHHVKPPFVMVFHALLGWWFGTCFIFPYIGNNNPN